MCIRTILLNSILFVFYLFFSHIQPERSVDTTKLIDFFKKSTMLSVCRRSSYVQWLICKVVSRCVLCCCCRRRRRCCYFIFFFSFYFVRCSHAHMHTLLWYQYTRCILVLNSKYMVRIQHPDNTFKLCPFSIRSRRHRLLCMTNSPIWKVYTVGFAVVVVVVVSKRIIARVMDPPPRFSHSLPLFFFLTRPIDLKVLDFIHIECVCARVCVYFDCAFLMRQNQFAVHNCFALNICGVLGGVLGGVPFVFVLYSCRFCMVLALAEIK